MHLRAWCFLCSLVLLLVASCVGGGTEHRCGDGYALPEGFVYPEGIAYGDDGFLYVGSLMTGQIARIPYDGGEGEIFVAADEDDIDNPLGMLYDGNRGVLWVCSINLAFTESRLVGFSLADGSVRIIHTMPPASAVACNDLTTDSKGNLYVTDSFGPHILILPAERAFVADSLEVWVEDPMFFDPVTFRAPNGIVFDGDAAIYTVLVDFTEGVLVRIPIETDGSAGTPEVVETSETLAGGDGIERLGEGLLGIVQFNLHRLTRIDLSTTPAQVTVIATGLDYPTTFALNDTATEALVVESQMDFLYDPPGEEPDLPFCIARVPLP